MRNQIAFFCLLSYSLTALSQLQDIYPDRRQLWAESEKIYQQVRLNKNTEKTPELLRNRLSLVFKIQEFNFKFDSSGWRADLEASLPPLPFNFSVSVLSSDSNYSFNYRTNKNSIESIARMSFDENCRMQSTVNTYYNSEFRPTKRVQRDSTFDETRQATIEEPIKPLNEIDLENEPEVAAMTNTALVRVGIIDSGIDYNHPKLALKTRPFLGLDLTDPKRLPYDYTNSVLNEMIGKSFSHGTAVAEIASRNIPALIIPMRITGHTDLAGQAIKELAQRNVRLINISQGSESSDEWLPLKIEMQNHPNILFIVAAGNEETNIDLSPTYPAGFDLPNMIVVASVDRNNNLSEFSNYGAQHVHLAACGENILAAQAGGGEKIVQGTSFAAPIVTRAAAKILISNPDISISDLKTRLIQSAKKIPSLKDKIKYGVIE